ncbi:MAG TPA: DoxX family protein [Saprospiraceae bacterium]|nr:DoxX family protein [Saprospiraceae bacterium]
MSNKTKSILQWTLAGLIGMIFLGSAINKFIGSEETVQMAAGIGLTLSTLKILGAVELISIILFLIPRTGILGTMLLTAYMGGAIFAHLGNGHPILSAVIIQALLWIAAVVRFPALTQTLKGV